MEELWAGQIPCTRHCRCRSVSGSRDGFCAVASAAAAPGRGLELDLDLLCDFLPAFIHAVAMESLAGGSGARARALSHRQRLRPVRGDDARTLRDRIPG